MNETELSQYITDTFASVGVVVDSDNRFFFYNPADSVPPDYYLFQFATLVTNDAYDQFSNLNRPSAYRLNIGISKETFRSLFGSSESASGGGDTDESSAHRASYDYTAFDQLMPHPEYGRLHWVCIVSPSDDTFETTVRPLLVEAYELAVSKYNKQAARRET